MHLDPLLPRFVASAFGVLLLGLLARRLGQPPVLAYLVSGLLLGPGGLGVFGGGEVATRLGDIGVVLLLFFVGMEVSPQRLLSGWRVAVAGFVVQVALSVALMAGVGWALDWGTGRIVLLGFAMALSSTAVVVSILRHRGALESPAGQDALRILLMQDMALAPMVVVLGLLGGEAPTTGTITAQVVGGAAFLVLALLAMRPRGVHLPFRALLRADHELQVFAAALLCFGLAALSGAMGLSTALGAFVAGLVVAAARETDWVHRSLEPVHTVFVAVFFVSVGMLLDPAFLMEHLGLMAFLVVATFVMNTAVNAVALRVAGRPWGASLRRAALLAQVGELSFVLAAVGRQAGMITDFAYQLVLGIITLTLLLSPLWIETVRRMTLRGTGGDDAAGSWPEPERA